MEDHAQVPAEVHAERVGCRSIGFVGLGAFIFLYAQQRMDGSAVALFVLYPGGITLGLTVSIGGLAGRS